MEEGDSEIRAPSLWWNLEGEPHLDLDLDFTSTTSVPAPVPSSILALSNRPQTSFLFSEVMPRNGAPKHQNEYAWKPNSGQKKNEKELGGRCRPYSDVTGVCPRCKEQIEWKRRYGKYKPLVEPAKCQKCTKRAVRQAYHNLCSGCAKDLNLCAKCCCSTTHIVGRDVSEVEAERKELEEAIKNARERDRRTLLRAMNKGKARRSTDVVKIEDRSREGDLFPVASIDEYAELANQNGSDEGDDDSDDDLICS